VALKGLLAQGDGGVLLLAMAERISAAAATRFCAVLDTQEVVLERDGLTSHNPARLGLVALDEGARDDERMPASLLERMAFRLVLDSTSDDDPGPEWSAEEVLNTRGRLERVELGQEGLQALCAAADALGIDSLRAPLFAARVARTAAALAACSRVEEEHIALAARLVLAPRATRVPEAPPPQETPEAPDTPQPEPGDAPEPPAEPDATAPKQPPENPPPHERSDEDDAPPNEAPPEPEEPLDTEGSHELGERILEAAQAAIPAGLLASLKFSQLSRAKTPTAGKVSITRVAILGPAIAALTSRSIAASARYVCDSMFSVTLSGAPMSTLDTHAASIKLRSAIATELPAGATAKVTPHA
jgi:magnesium chelatase subunit D